MRACTVVIVPGLGSAPEEWAAVLDALPPGVATLTIDPADSPRLRDPAAWSPDAVASRLAMRVAGSPRPLLLVGHSSGGLHVQAYLYSRTLPGGGAGDSGTVSPVVGAVLVDASHQVAVRPVPAVLTGTARAIAEVVLATGVMALLGPWLRVVAVWATSVRRRDRMTSDMIRAVYSSQAWARTTLDAWLGHGRLQAGVLDWHRERGAPRVAVRLIVGAAGTGRGRAGWIATQRDLARRLGAPDPTLLDDAGHLVTIDRPDAVVTAIQEFLHLVDAEQPPRPGSSH